MTGPLWPLLAALVAATPAAPAAPAKAPAAACLPASPLPGLGAVDPFHAPDAKATELNSAGKSYYRDGKWEEARIEYRAAEAADRVPGAAVERRLFVRPPGALRRGHRGGGGVARPRLRPLGA